MCSTPNAATHNRLRIRCSCEAPDWLAVAKSTCTHQAIFLGSEQLTLSTSLDRANLLWALRVGFTSQTTLLQIRSSGQPLVRHQPMYATFARPSRAVLPHFSFRLEIAMTNGPMFRA